MSNSPLVSYTKISPNTYGKRGTPTKITIHHMAVVNASLVAIGNQFAKPSRKASSNYGIDSKGNVALYLGEDYAPETSSNRANDMQAVTIEVSNCKGAPNWEISDAAYNKLIDLCVDICQRNGIKALNFTGDKNGNLTEHCMFAATACPGPYLKGRMKEIANTVNTRLNGNSAPVPTPTTTTKPATSTTTTTSKEYKVKVTATKLNIRAGAGTNYKVVGCITDKGVYTIVDTKNGWGKLKSGKGWIYLSYTKKI